MKKLISTFMIVTLLICCFTATAFASNQTVLTTTVPDATYTLNIPDNQEIAFRTIETDIGAVTITDASGFAAGKNVSVTIAHSDFTCEDNTTTIPYNLVLYYKDGGHTNLYSSEDGLLFRGQYDGTVAVPNVSSGNYRLSFEKIALRDNSEDWGKALGGEYSSTITFTSEIVVSE